MCVMIDYSLKLVVCRQLHNSKCSCSGSAITRLAVFLFWCCCLELVSCVTMVSCWYAVECIIIVDFELYEDMYPLRVVKPEPRPSSCRGKTGCKKQTPATRSNREQAASGRCYHGACGCRSLKGRRSTVASRVHIFSGRCCSRVRLDSCIAP